MVHEVCHYNRCESQITDNLYLIMLHTSPFLLFKLFNVNPNNQIKHLTLLLVQWGAVVAVIVWWLDLQLPMQSVPIATDVVSSNLDHGEVCNMMR
jgi:hypothetical protein